MWRKRNNHFISICSKLAEKENKRSCGIFEERCTNCCWDAWISPQWPLKETEGKLEIRERINMMEGTAMLDLSWILRGVLEI